MKDTYKIYCTAAGGVLFCLLQPYLEHFCRAYASAHYEGWPLYLCWSVSLLLFALFVFCLFSVALARPDRRNAAHYFALCLLFAALFVLNLTGLVLPSFNFSAAITMIFYFLCALRQYRA